jgi:hypothetical protein
MQQSTSRARSSTVTVNNPWLQPEFRVLQRNVGTRNIRDIGRPLTHMLYRIGSALTSTPSARSSFSRTKSALLDPTKSPSQFDTHRLIDEAYKNQEEWFTRQSTVCPGFQRCIICRDHREHRAVNSQTKRQV